FLLSYQTENDAPRFTQASALVQIADWDLLFAPDHTFVESALEVYEEAYGQLEQSGMAQRSVDRLFHPEIPVVLPAFLPNPLATSETSETTGFIDVTFDITQEGESEDIEILDTVNASDDEQDRLIDLIDDSRFRPVLANGRVAETARVALRYFLNDLARVPRSATERARDGRLMRASARSACPSSSAGIRSRRRTPSP